MKKNVPSTGGKILRLILVYIHKDHHVLLTAAGAIILLNIQLKYTSYY